MASLMCLDDAMLCRILRALVGLETSCQAVLKSIVLVNKRFYQLTRHPSFVWELVEVHEDVDRLSASKAASLASWLAAVGPGVKTLRLWFSGDDAEPDGAAPEPVLDVSAFLPTAVKLESLFMTEVYLRPADIPILASLTTLTYLNFSCHLPGGAEPLAALSTLQRLRRLEFDLGLELEADDFLLGRHLLPEALCALSGLKLLGISCHGLRHHDPRVQLPRAWCATLAALESLSLQRVELPPQEQFAAASILPALKTLELSTTRDDPATASLAGCTALEDVILWQAPLNLATWEALGALPRLSSLSLEGCTGAEDAQFEGAAELGGRFAALRSLDVARMPLPRPILGIPTLHYLKLEAVPFLGWQQLPTPGWALPAGPYLDHLVELEIEQSCVGSVAAVWERATALTSLDLAGCPWLQFGREGLQALLALPLEWISIEGKEPNNSDPDDYDSQGESLDDQEPAGVWNEDSQWVLQQLGAALEERQQQGQPVRFEVPALEV